MQLPANVHGRVRDDMRKLVIQIPCYNEAETLPDTLAELPDEVEGFDEVEVIIVDDGSSDDTAGVARSLGVAEVTRFVQNRGLAAAFRAGLETALRRGADVIVNTDADNQYRAADIPKLVEPILAERADIVVGDRGVANLEGFSPVKRRLQQLGSWVIGRASGISTPDATSGFRAFTREAALRTLVLSDYSYTLETLIHAGVARNAVEFVPIRVNPQTRPSRLFKSMGEYIGKSGVAIVRAYTSYQPLRVFTVTGLGLIALGMIPGIRFLMFFLSGDRVGHVQSLILAAILTIVGFQVVLFGLVADSINRSRRMLEEVVYRVRTLELDRNRDDSRAEPETPRTDPDAPRDPVTPPPDRAP